MQRDQKVGLALGVLLIGAVAAFFFRNEPDPTARMSQLASAEEVDREIAEKRLTPYFPEVDDGANVPATASAKRPDAGEIRTGERRLPRWEELQADDVDPFTGHSAQQGIPAPAPDPIPTGTAATEPPARQTPGETRSPDERVTAAPSDQELLHEVQRGETLSSLAGRYLGSQARYLEIFEANTDQLRDANDLQVGMSLRIPIKNSPPAAKTLPSPRIKPPQEPKPITETESTANKAPVFVPASSANSSAPPTPEESTTPVSEQNSAAEPPKRKFAPAKRRPRSSPSSG